MQGQGVIKWFRRDKGFGFIAPQSGDEDVFLHQKLCDQLSFEPRDGVTVQYKACKTPRGWKATWIGMQPSTAGT